MSPPTCCSPSHATSRSRSPRRSGPASASWSSPTWASPLVSLEDVGGRTIHVRKNSDHHASLIRLNEQLKKINRPPATIVVDDATKTDEDLLDSVNAGRIRATIVDDYVFDRWQSDLLKIAAPIAMSRSARTACSRGPRARTRRSCSRCSNDFFFDAQADVLIMRSRRLHAVPFLSMPAAVAAQPTSPTATTSKRSTMRIQTAHFQIFGWLVARRYRFAARLIVSRRNTARILAGSRPLDSSGRSPFASCRTRRRTSTSSRGTSACAIKPRATSPARRSFVCSTRRNLAVNVVHEFVHAASIAVNVRDSEQPALVLGDGRVL